MTLLNAEIGHKYCVISVQLEQKVGRRLEALGLTEGTQLVVLNNKKSGSLIFKIRGTRLAIGRKIADSILVKEEV